MSGENRNLRPLLRLRGKGVMPIPQRSNRGVPRQQAKKAPKLAKAKDMRKAPARGKPSTAKGAKSMAARRTGKSKAALGGRPSHQRRKKSD